MTASADQATRPADQDGGSYDVVIIGAGISGIGAAYHLGQSNAATHYVILERREGRHDP